LRFVAAGPWEEAGMSTAENSPGENNQKI